MENNTEQLEKLSKRMRLKALDMAYWAGKNGAHLGGGLSSIEIFAVLYGNIARIDSTNPYWEDRDRILVSKAHCVLAYYAVLNEAGYLKDKDLASFEKNGSSFAGHPVKNIGKGIEYSGGSLGMALSVAVGMAIHAKNIRSKRKIFVLLGDGECEEGSIWEAFMLAAKYKLDNLTVIVDWNGLQYDGTIEEVGGLENLSEKIRAFGWNVSEINGHDISELNTAFQIVNRGAPFAIIAKTVKGKGVSFMENNPVWHHSELKKELYIQAKEEIEKRR